jgi:hypothetical protein
MTGRDIVLDSNLLLLLVVGSASRRYIASHKRLRSFTEADFERLLAMLDGNRLLLTPNTLTETSNLAALDLKHDPARSQIRMVLRRFIDAGDEIMVASRTGAAQDEFLRLGLTDSVLLSLGSPSTTLLTTDLDLYIAAGRRGQAAENFNHFRGL